MDRRAALEAAFDEMEGAEDTPEGTGDEVKPEAVESPPPEGEQEPTGQADSALEKDESAEKAGKEVAPATEKGEKAPKVGKADAALEQARKAAVAPAGEAGKPPISWKGAVKDKWAALPVDVRQEVLRREKEINQYISQNDHHRKFTEGFARVTQPFSHLIQAQGSTPLQAVRNLFTTAAGLMTGNVEQKARIVAEIIANYSVDIGTLDKVLTNAPHVIGNQGAGVVPPAVLQALQPIQGFMNEVQQARQQREMRQQQEAMTLVEESSDLPYFDDLRDDMADLLDIAAKRGVEMSLQQAYEKSLALNPEISKIVARDKAIAEAKANGGTRLAKARRAASTIAGAPAGVPLGGGKPASRREAIAAAWDDASE